MRKFSIAGYAGAGIGRVSLCGIIFLFYFFSVSYLTCG